MRVLVQHCKTLEYWRGLQRWTKNDFEAMDFQKSVKAIEFCVREGLFNTQIVLRFGEDRTFDIVLPIAKPHAKAGSEPPQKLSAA